MIPVAHGQVASMISTKQFGSILNLYHLLTNIKSDLSNIDKKDTTDTYEITRNIAIIIEKMFSINFGCNMFIFADWANLFSDTQKIEAIEIAAKYDLLNISKINPKKVLPLLANIDFSNNIYSKLYNKIEYENTDVHFNRDLVNLHKGVSSLNIISYYPTFACKILDYVPAIIEEKMGDFITISFTKYSQISLSINTVLAFTNNQYYENITNTYTIQKIVKYSNEKQIEVEHAEYVSPKILDRVVYGICLDKPLEEDKTSMIYVFQHIVHEISKC